MVVIAAVSVVFPWSTWPIVPTFTCGLRSNCALAIGSGQLVCWFWLLMVKNQIVGARAKSGASDRDRTDDLVLTKDVLGQLSLLRHFLFLRSAGIFEIPVRPTPPSFRGRKSPDRTG